MTSPDVSSLPKRRGREEKGGASEPRSGRGLFLGEKRGCVRDGGRENEDGSGRIGNL